MVGGSILKTSQECVNVRRVGILKYGVMDKIKLAWRKSQVTIISTYRPYENEAKGSLRTTMNKATSNFEEDYWDALVTNLEGEKVIIGGDFNLEAEELDEKIKGMELERAEMGEDQYTFKADIEERGGKCIDHILSRGLVCTAKVTQTGIIVRDHMPIIATTEILGPKDN